MKMKKIPRINGKEVESCGYFAFDGCHKFYICGSKEEVKMMRDYYGYEFILPIKSLPEAWNNTTCCLRFIYSADLCTTYVEQGDDAVFTGW